MPKLVYGYNQLAKEVNIFVGTPKQVKHSEVQKTSSDLAEVANALITLGLTKVRVYSLHPSFVSWAVETTRRLKNGWGLPAVHAD